MLFFVFCIHQSILKKVSQVPIYSLCMYVYVCMYTYSAALKFVNPLELSIFLHKFDPKHHQIFI